MVQLFKKKKCQASVTTFQKVYYFKSSLARTESHILENLLEQERNIDSFPTLACESDSVLITMVSCEVSTDCLWRSLVLCRFVML